jgi:hypothetical protein
MCTRVVVLKAKPGGRAGILEFTPGKAGERLEFLLE